MWFLVVVFIGGGVLSERMPFFSDCISAAHSFRESYKKEQIQNIKCIPARLKRRK